MGCSSSRQFVVNNKRPGQDAKALRDFYELGFSKSDVDSLFNSFCKFDVIGDGELEFGEFITRLKIETTQISKEIFSDMDKDSDGSINFREVRHLFSKFLFITHYFPYSFFIYKYNLQFVISMFLYLIKTKESIAEFAFDMFDKDNSNALNRNEIEEMIKFVYGNNDLGGHVKKIIDTMDTSHDGRISKREFVVTANKFPALLFPAFEMQVSFLCILLLLLFHNI